MHAEDILISVLETFDIPVIRQGSLLPDEAYPDEFFTFWNHSSVSERFYDNKENAYVYDFDVNFYSINPENLYATLREAIKKLKAAGFIVSGGGYDAASDEATHDGRGVSCVFLEKSEEKELEYENHRV